METLIATKDDRGSAAREISDEIGMRHDHTRTIRQTECERPKWSRVDHLVPIICPHVIGLSVDLAHSARLLSYTRIDSV